MFRFKSGRPVFLLQSRVVVADSEFHLDLEILLERFPGLALVRIVDLVPAEAEVPDVGLSLLGLGVGIQEGRVEPGKQEQRAEN